MSIRPPWRLSQMGRTYDLLGTLQRNRSGRVGERREGGWREREFGGMLYRILDRIPTILFQSRDQIDQHEASRRFHVKSLSKQSVSYQILAYVFVPFPTSVP